MLAGNQDEGSHASEPKRGLWQIAACQRMPGSHLGRVSPAPGRAGTSDSSGNKMAHFITIRRTLSRKVCERAGCLPKKELIKTLSRDGESSWHLAACLKLYRNKLKKGIWSCVGAENCPILVSSWHFLKQFNGGNLTDAFVSQRFNEVYNAYFRLNRPLI